MAVTTSPSLLDSDDVEESLVARSELEAASKDFLRSLESLGGTLLLSSEVATLEAERSAK